MISPNSKQSRTKSSKANRQGFINNNQGTLNQNKGPSVDLLNLSVNALLNSSVDNLPNEVDASSNDSTNAVSKKSNSQYSALAYAYDKLNFDIDYESFVDFYEKCFTKYLKEPASLILDLACGTGSITFPMAKRGYDMIGVDLSCDMLMCAADKRYDANLEVIEAYEKVLFLLQDMRSFELYGTVDAVVCCLDGVNYLTEPSDVEQCFKTVHNYLNPDGLFIFDINSPYKYRNIYANNSYCLESEKGDVFCAWQNYFDEESKLCDFYLTIFEATDDEKKSYRRTDETQHQRLYEIEQLEKMLINSSFEVLEIVGERDFSSVKDTSEKIYFVAKAKK